MLRVRSGEATADSNRFIKMDVGAPSSQSTSTSAFISTQGRQLVGNSTSRNKYGLFIEKLPRFEFESDDVSGTNPDRGHTAAMAHDNSGINASNSSFGIYPLDANRQSDPSQRELTRKSFLSRHSLRGTLGRVFRIQQHPHSQLESRLFKLPLELRQQIYMYLFADSLIYNENRDPLTDWDYLLLSCRRVKNEMESLPVRPIFDALEKLYNRPYCPFKAQLTANYKDGQVDEIIARVPRAVLQPESKYRIWHYVPDYLSPLFRIHTNTLTFEIIDDGTPQVNLRKVPVEMDLYFRMYGVMLGRHRKLRRIVNRTPLLEMSPSCTRNYLNCKKLVVHWGDTFQRPIAFSGIDHALEETFRASFSLVWVWMRIKFSNIYEKREDGTWVLRGVIWKSSNRFR